jgi:hypothetical protein
MKHVFHSAVLISLALLALGCSSEPEKKPEAKKPTFLTLKIQSPLVRTITVDPDGSVADVISGSPAVKFKLSADGLKSLQDLAAKVEWAKIPGEGFKTDSGNPVKDGRVYDLTYGGVTPTRTVHSMDGATEDASFTKLRDAVELDANKAGK